jgi:hypothetical protein
VNRTPVRYAKRHLLSWVPYCNWSPIKEARTFQTLQAAVDACEQDAGKALAWTISNKTTPEGHSWQTGTYASDASRTWQVTPQYDHPRESIPDAEFVSLDPKCTFYVVPDGKSWAVYSQYDMEDAAPGQMLLMGLANDMISDSDSRRLWHFFQCVDKNKQRAQEIGRYLWARSLIRSIEPPLTHSRLASFLRNLARKRI